MDPNGWRRKRKRALDFPGVSASPPAHPWETVMSFDLHAASAPVFEAALTNMIAWLDKARAAGVDEAKLMEARLAPDMKPFPFQFQSASDAAKGAVARLTGGQAPAMPDTEASFDELRERLRKTVDYIRSVPAAAYEGGPDRAVEMRFPNGMGYGWRGADFLTGFALPNFFFHVSMAYALLRANGVQLGKPDFLQHLGPPNLAAA